MKRDPRKSAGMLRDVSRLIGPLDVMYQVGNLIFKKSLRYTLLTAGLGVVGVITHSLNLPGFTVRQAILLPLAIGLGCLVVGGSFKAVPRLISSRLFTVAQASGLNLMEDYRKSEVDGHLRVLWDRLFQHECRLRLRAGATAFDGVSIRLADGEDPDAAVGRARAEYLARAHKALATPQPQIRQMHEVGLDLRYLEDWRDGAYLDRSDTKLVEQFEGNATLLAARREVGLTGTLGMIRFRLRPGVPLAGRGEGALAGPLRGRRRAGAGAAGADHPARVRPELRGRL